MGKNPVLVANKKTFGEAKKEAAMLTRKGWKAEVKKGHGTHPYNIYVTNNWAEAKKIAGKAKLPKPVP